MKERDKEILKEISNFLREKNHCYPFIHKLHLVPRNTKAFSESTINIYINKL